MKIKDLEVRLIKELENKYAISKDGRVFRVGSKRELKRYPTGRSKYLGFRASINGKAYNEFVHVNVARAWVENPDPANKDQVNHKNGDKLNNHYSNLEWVTHSQNIQHAFTISIRGKGEDLYNSSLTEDQVHLICARLEDGCRPKDLADVFGTTPDVIRKISSGDTYYHIRCLYNIPHNYRNFLSESTVRWVCSKIVTGVSDTQISKSSSNKNVTRQEVKRIRYKIRYKNISDEYF